MPDDDTYASLIRILLSPAPTPQEAMSQAMGVLLSEVIKIRDAVQTLRHDVDELQTWRKSHDAKEEQNTKEKKDIADESRNTRRALGLVALGTVLTAAFAALLQFGEWVGGHFGFKP